MKPCVLAFVLAICACGGLASSAGTSAAHDCYIDAKVVKNWIETPAGVPKGSWQPEGVSFIEKEIYRMGDRLALGIVHAYTRKELLDPDRLRRVLSLVRLSFSEPGFIVRSEDAHPAVTMLLLSVLEHECGNKQLQQTIIDTEKYISSQVAERHAIPSK